MKKARLAAQSRAHLDKRFKQIGPSFRYDPPVRGWIRAIREALGMTTLQLGHRLGVKQPSVAAMEKSEVKGSIELATLRRVAEALDCTLVYALVPNKTLEDSVRNRARAYERRRRDPIEHSMRLENQGVKGTNFEVRLDEVLRETNPRIFWDS